METKLKLRGSVWVRTEIHTHTEYIVVRRVCVSVRDTHYTLDNTITGRWLLCTPAALQRPVHHSISRYFRLPLFTTIVLMHKILLKKVVAIFYYVPSFWNKRFILLNINKYFCAEWIWNLIFDKIICILVWVIKNALGQLADKG